MHGLKFYICIFIHLQIIRLLISQVFLLERASEAVSVSTDMPFLFYCDVYLRIMNYQKRNIYNAEKRKNEETWFDPCC